VKWLFPEVHPLEGENAVLKVLRYGTPLYILSEERRFGHLRSGISEPGLSDYAAALGADTIRRKKPDLTAIHLIDLDEARHHHGTFSPEADEAVKRNDRRLHDLLSALRETPGMEDTLMVVLSDHGQENIECTVNLTKALEEIGLNRQILAQSNGMSAYFFPGEEKEADFEAIRALLDDQKAKMGISKLYSRAELDAMHAVEGPVLAAEAAPGVVFSDSLDEEKREKATHGFGPGRDADNCLFAVWGKGVRKGIEIPGMKMRDVGPTIAGLMGLELPEAQGEDLSSLFLE
jgi:predicted AlkP superfamily pyrophosphatase or phosphodiesterase